MWVRISPQGEGRNALHPRCMHRSPYPRGRGESWIGLDFTIHDRFVFTTLDRPVFSQA
jgi:hypothetical protein